MPSEEEQIQFIQALEALENFVRILVREYPLVFKDGSGGLKISSSIQKQLFHYEASLEVRKI